MPHQSGIPTLPGASQLTNSLGVGRVDANRSRARRDELAAIQCLSPQHLFAPHDAADDDRCLPLRRPALRIEGSLSRTGRPAQALGQTLGRADAASVKDQMRRQLVAGLAAAVAVLDHERGLIVLGGTLRTGTKKEHRATCRTWRNGPGCGNDDSQFAFFGIMSGNRLPPTLAELQRELDELRERSEQAQRKAKLARHEVSAIVEQAERLIASARRLTRKRRPKD